MNIMPNRMDREYYKHQQEYESKALEVLRTGWYVLGKELEAFENEFVNYCRAKHCVGVASGLDALWLAFKALGVGKGDEVIVQGNTYIASVMGVAINGAIPIFVEPDVYYSIDAHKIREKITKRTKAILVVHLYGCPADMNVVVDICKKYDLQLVEDCTQSHGAIYKGRITGTFGDIGCFSFYPSKNIGAFGEGGVIITDNEKNAKAIRIYRNYGSEKRYYNKVVGTNSRLDELQAGLLRIKLKYLDEINRERNEIAIYYKKYIENKDIIQPLTRNGTFNVWHQYVIRCEPRSKLTEYLTAKGIGTLIHYLIPPHNQKHIATWAMEKGTFQSLRNMQKRFYHYPYIMS